MNKTLHKAALLSFLGLASAVAVQAQNNGDLLIGFTSQTGNDLIYDLGSASSLTDGETWNLTSLLTGVDLTTVNWGVIGGMAPVSGTGYAWTTIAAGSPAPMGLTKNQWSPVIGTPLSAIFQNLPGTGAGQSISIAANDDNSWNTQTLSPNIPGDWANTYGNPNVQGLTSDTLYQTTATTGSPAPVDLGGFTLGSNGTVTYSVAPTPEPSTYALAALAGLLALTRLQSFRKQA